MVGGYIYLSKKVAEAILNGALESISTGNSVVVGVQGVEDELLAQCSTKKPLICRITLPSRGGEFMFSIDYVLSEEGVILNAFMAGDAGGIIAVTATTITGALTVKARVI